MPEPEKIRAVLLCKYANNLKLRARLGKVQRTAIYTSTREVLWSTKLICYISKKVKKVCHYYLLGCEKCLVPQEPLDYCHGLLLPQILEQSGVCFLGLQNLLSRLCMIGGQPVLYLHKLTARFAPGMRDDLCGHHAYRTTYMQIQYAEPFLDTSPDF